MARPPKSEAEKELSGAYQKNPQRRKKAAGTDAARELGRPPKKFLDKFSPTSRDHLEAWNEIRAIAVAAGLELTEAHRLAVEALARAVVIMRRSTKTSDCANVSALAKELGLAKIPTRREIAKAAEKPEDDEWSRMTTPPAPPATRVQ